MTGEWPVVVVGRESETSNSRVNEEFFTVLGAALERQERFGMIVVKTAIDPGDVRRTEAELAGIRWLKTARDSVARWCAGIAYVVAEASLDDERVRRGIAAGPTVYGCPTAAFADRAGARQWLAEALPAPVSRPARTPAG